MSRAVRFSEIREASPAVREKALTGIIAEARAPANGSLTDLDARITGYEERYGLTSDQLLDELSTGKREETADVLSWLMLLRVRGRVGPARSS